MSDVFISWSGGRSRSIASGLKEWIEYLFQGRHAWMSEQDIQAGARWLENLSAELESSHFGIVCLTPENLDCQWLLFESGALSKAIKSSLVVPYRFELKSADVRPPLSQFQGVDANEEGTLKLVQSINDALGRPLSTEKLSKTFEKWWPELDAALKKIPQCGSVQIRTERDILEEVLQLVRSSRLETITLDDCLKYTNWLWRQMEILEYRMESNPGAAEEDSVYKELGHRMGVIGKVKNLLKEAIDLQADHRMWRNGPSMEERDRLKRGERL